MRLLRILVLGFSATAFVHATQAISQNAASTSATSPRITERVDENQLVTLKGNTHPAATAANDLGPVRPNLPMTDLVLVLSRSPEQQAAFDEFVASQYDSSSPNFHHWLQPGEVGERFGPSLGDIATISSWLASHGFSVAEVSKDRVSIRFSGTAAQVQSAFHTEIHNLSVNGERHIANMRDPEIPAALAPVVAGIKALHDFKPKPQHRLGSTVTFNSTSGKWQRIASSVPMASASGLTAPAVTAHPEFGITVGSGTSAYLIEDVAPYDFATIYNVLPLWNATTPVTGTGQMIAIAGTSDITLSDVATFRSAFGLPAGLTPQEVKGANGLDPGICTSTSPTATCTIDDLTENSLDVEWSGSVAPGAQIVLVTSGAQSATDDTVYDSSSYVVENNGNSSSPVANAHILSVSYGECELGEGTSGNAAYNNLWQTAATEGIAVFVATGDAGSATCDQGLDTSSPYAAQYGLSVSGLASTPYNTAVGGTDLNWGTTASPYWNATNNSTTGASAIGYMPEVPWNDTCTNPIIVASINSQLKSNLTATQICDEIYTQQIYSTSDEAGLQALVDVVGGGGGVSACTTSDGQTVASCTGGYAKPSWQTGVTGIPADGKRDLPDVSFFASNGFLGSAYLICVSANGACTYSSTTEPTAQEVGGTSVATPAMAGVMALVNQKAGAPQGNPNAELYSLAARQNYASCSAESVTVSGSCYFNDVDTGTNAMPCNYSDASPNCTGTDKVGILTGYSAAAGFDPATGLGSLNVANVVNGWTSTIGAGAATVTVTPAQTSITVAQALSVSVTVTATSGTPTGSVTLTGPGYAGATQTLSTGPYTFNIPAGGLSPGTDTLTAGYSGDANFAEAHASATVTVTKLTPVITAAPSATSIESNVALTVSGTISGTGPTPTGTVTLTGGGYTSAATNLSSGSYSITIPANSLSGGTDTLTVAYSGDANYIAGSAATSVAVTTYVPLIPSVMVTPVSSTIGSGETLNVTIAVTGGGPTPTGTITLSSGSYISAAEVLSGGSYTITIPANKLAVGTDTLTAAYSGDNYYAAGGGTASVTVTASAYSLAASATTAVAPGSSASSTVTISSTSGYAGTVTVTCALTTSPAGASDLPGCTPNAGSSTVTLSSTTTTGTATVTVTTTAATSGALMRPAFPGNGKGLAGAGSAVLALLVLLGIPARRRSWRAMLGLFALLLVLGSLAACGGGGGSGGGGGTGNPGTTAGTYTFTVTGTGSPAETPAPTATVTVTVN
jgi:hypothetical protein